MAERLKFQARGDDAIAIIFGNEIDPVINQEIRKFLIALEQKKPVGFIEAIPSYTQVTVIYDPLRCYYEEIVDDLYQLTDTLSSFSVPDPKVIEIPVVYGGEYGPDLEALAAHHGIDSKEVVSIHSSGEYLIYMLGFTPGFPYLGGMDPGIATPRLENPREKIPAGSVGIAGSQTGIYPIESPGGWQIIGRTPLKLFDTERKPEILLSSGDYIQFYPVSEEEYLKLGGIK